TRYLAEIAETVRAHHRRTGEQAEMVRRHWHLQQAAATLEEAGQPKDPADILARLKEEAAKAEQELDEETRQLLKEWPEMREAYSGDEFVYKVRDREFKVPLHTESLSRQKIPRVVLPRFKDPGEIYRWLREENVPGRFPFTAGVFPFKRTDEEPTRMFAGEGDPARTNRRFKLLSEHHEAKRLSTAFDSVTLYGYDPDERPDIYGKVGTSGVSVCSLDDMKILYDGFDLCA
ncbi:MAG: methylmalonyl-CoA mutase, partial [Deltaproteobacteria bacterium]|nr:methylmalonyl-CoA mutase [Deltaproteobacteria bacterium]